MTVYFCKTDYQLNGGYQSYSDFFTLAELAGYPVIPLSQLNPNSDDTYIVTPLNGEWTQGWQNPRARIILWECEWRVDQWHIYTGVPEGVAEVWASDHAYANKIGARFVLFGSDARLATQYGTKPQDKWYDVALLQYINPRRETILHDLREAGLTVAPNGWDDYRDRVLRQSRVMLHIHQHDNAPYNAFIRLAIAAAYRLPVISEAVEDVRPYIENGDTYTVLYADYPELARVVRLGLDHFGYLGEWLHDFLCIQHPFGKCVEGAL